MILVDSSVWIDYLTEVLQEFQGDKDFKTARDLLLRIPFMQMGGYDIALRKRHQLSTFEEKRHYSAQDYRCHEMNFCTRKRIENIYEVFFI